MAQRHDARVYEMTLFPVFSITASQMTTIDDKIMRDKEAPLISAISEAAEAAISLCTYVYTE